MSWYILDENDNPVKEDDVSKAAKWLEENSDRRIVEKTVLINCELSTVFLCLDHSFDEEIPILYESLWFGGILDGNMRRYATKEEALAGHEEMLEEIKKAWYDSI